MAEPLSVRQSFSVGRKTYRRGQIIRGDDPVVKGREHLFETAASRIERATAAPGERRNVSPPKSFACHCGFEAKTEGGLTTHQRTHEED